MKSWIAASCGIALVLVAVSMVSATPLPYDRTSPVIYDNDGSIESGFTDVYVAALASAGVINLRGIITTGSYAEESRQPPYSPVPEAESIMERQELVEKALRSGLRNLADVTAGPSVSLTSRRPASGRIEDTVPFGTSGSWLIVNEARTASSTRPLVVLMGGQPTAAVDAYLLDPTIADKMVLAWIVGNKRSDGNIDCREYNCGVDPWATYIAFKRLRVVAFPFSNDGVDTNDPIAATPKSRLGELPDTEVRETMVESRWPREGGTYSEPAYDYDAMPTFPLTRSDYVVLTKNVSFSYWEPAPWNSSIQIPFFRDDPNGRTLVVWDASAAVATDEWWWRIKDPAAWGPSVGQIAMNGIPWAMPGTVEAEHFDHGGTNRAYIDTTNNWEQESWFNPIRFLEHVDILRSGTASGGFKVGRAVADEWIEYTINVAAAGIYTIEVRVASAGQGGTFNLAFNGANKMSSVQVPNTGGWDAWQLVSRTNVALDAGVQVVRLVMETNGATGAVGDFDYLKISSANPYCGDGSCNGGDTCSNCPNDCGLCPSQNPIAHWKLDEGSGTTAQDSSGNGNTGTIYGATWVIGKYGNGLSFDGGDDYISAGTGYRPTTAITVAFWIYPRALADGAGLVADLNYNDGAYYGILWDIDSDGITWWRAGEGNPGDAVANSPAGTLATNQWIHLAVTWENNITKFYKNGIQLTTSGSTNAAQISYTGAPGLEIAVNQQYLNATLDDIRIYNRALNQSEIQALYQSGSCVHKSDSTCDGCVDMSELTAFIDLWKVDSSNPTLKELIEAIGLWKRGC